MRHAYESLMSLFRFLSLFVLSLAIATPFGLFLNVLRSFFEVVLGIASAIGNQRVGFFTNSSNLSIRSRVVASRVDAQQHSHHGQHRPHEERRDRATSPCRHDAAIGAQVVGGGVLQILRRLVANFVGASRFADVGREHDQGQDLEEGRQAKHACQHEEVEARVLDARGRPQHLAGNGAHDEGHPGEASSRTEVVDGVLVVVGVEEPVIVVAEPIDILAINEIVSLLPQPVLEVGKVVDGGALLTLAGQAE
mmetsp:Transcript_11725/g.33824  ORF Transcript_11725/g.33824 Transcript_11725/m.33824 type:complete len:251 (+) Transcript_11725:214-966(+)